MTNTIDESIDQDGLSTSNTENKTVLPQNEVKISPQEEKKKPKFTITDKRFWARKKDMNSDEKTEVDEKTDLLRKPAYVQELEKKLKEHEEQLKKYISAYKENKNENAAFRERMKKNLETQLETRFSEFILNFLEVIDNFERSLTHSKENTDFEALFTGIKLTYSQMLSNLKAWDIIQLDRLGQEFDPKFDEVVAMSEPENDEDKNNIIIEEFQKAYTYKGKLLRPSKVRIIKNA